MTVDWIQSQLGITLEPWQAELLRKLHEVGPDGQYRRIFVYRSHQSGLRLVRECMEAITMDDPHHHSANRIDQRRRTH